MHQSEKPKLEALVKTGDGYLQSAKSFAALGGSLLQGVVVSRVEIIYGINKNKYDSIFKLFPPAFLQLLILFFWCPYTLLNNCRIAHFVFKGC